MKDSILWRFFFSTGLVSEPTGQVAQEGAHQERTRPAGSQCPSADVLRGADPGRGAGKEGEGSEREEAPQVSGKAAEEVGPQRHPGGLGQPESRVGDPAPQQATQRGHQSQ